MLLTKKYNYDTIKPKRYEIKTVPSYTAFAKFFVSIKTEGIGIIMHNKKLKVDKTILAWDEALPLGNGDLGCLIWNKSNKLRFSIDKAGIWDCSESPENQDGFSYDNLRKLVQEKNQREINRIFDDCYSKTTPTKLPTGKLIIDLGTRKNIVSELDFTTAEATLKVGDIILKSFVHSQEDYGLISINKPKIKYTIANPKFGVKGAWFKLPSKGISQSLKNLCYDKAVFFNGKRNDIEIEYFIQPTNDSYYGIFVAKKQTENSTLIAYTVGLSKDRDFNKELNTVTSAVSVGYDKALISHKQWWQNYFEKSAICLPDKQLEYNWYFNNYLLGSCSRKGKYPMPLQGVWTADNNNLPPWKGDYHHDLNTQMSYTSYLKANHIQEGEAYIDFLLSLTEVGRKFAKQYYGVTGVCLPSVMDIQGHALGGWAQYSLSPTNQLWLCLIMIKHYHYVGAPDYLKETLYPYLSEVGDFLMNLLVEEDGYYRLPLSTSPEIHNNSLESWLTPNSNYDLALMRAFMDEMISLSQELKLNDKKTYWETALSKMENLAINSDNVLMISKGFTLNESHRHLSHCMAIYPLMTMPYTQENKGIIDSTIASLEKLGIGYWVGYTLGWIANLYAVQNNGDKAYAMIKDFFSNYCTDNGFHCNGDHRKKTACKFKYRHFTLEGNFIATDAINNMLLYSEKFGLKLFPAIPKAWKNVSFENFCGYDGITVSAKMCDGKISYIKINAQKNVTINILNDQAELESIDKTITLKKNGVFEFNAENN